MKTYQSYINKMYEAEAEKIEAEKINQDMLNLKELDLKNKIKLLYTEINQKQKKISELQAKLNNVSKIV